jgi:hypothetical protein
MITKKNLMVAAAALALTGCAGIVTQPNLSPSNPANPTASEASYPPATPILMAGTNFEMKAQGDEQPMPDHNKMEMPNHDKMDMPMKH